VLEESEQRTDSVGDVHLVPYLRGVVGYESLEKGAEEAEMLDGGMVHDGWKRRRGRVQEADLGLHGFGTEQTL